MKKALAFALTFVACSTLRAGVVEDGAKLQCVSRDFAFTEGPASDKAGDVYFTDQPNDRILKWTASTGKIETFLQPCGRSNGLCFAPNGKLIACADEKNEMWAIDVPTKEHTLLFDNYQRKLLDGPNDVWVRPDGGLYFTDPYYKRDYWKRGPKEQGFEGVYYFPAGGGPLVAVAQDLKRPNGIIGTSDGHTLYVADIDARKTYSYTINPDGSLSDKKLFCAMGSDGMTIDQAGNVYLTGKGVTVFDKTGKKIDHIDVPESWTANVCFGGADRKTLFITASKGVYTIRTTAAGAGSQ